MYYNEEPKHKVTATNTSFPTATVLTIVFVVLKLCKVINWSWWWILSPIWISVGSIVGVWMVTLLILVILKAIAVVKDKQNERDK